MLESVGEWRRLLQARKWMKQNAAFLPAWHAYVGYKMGLFDKFREAASPSEVAAIEGLDAKLLQNWVDAGVVLGHLRKSGDRIRATTSMLAYVSNSSSQSVGMLLEELMEMHIPTLLRFPELMRGEKKPSFETERYGPTVAATSSLLEKLAFPKVCQWVKDNQARSILDIGCGHGGYLKRLFKKLPHLKLIGLEQNRDVCEQARRQSPDQELQSIAFVHGDFTTWDGPEEPVDLIMMNNILHYFHPETRGKLFERADRLLGVKGTISMISPLYLTGSGQAFSVAFNSYMSAHDNLYGFPTEAELTQTAAAHGFEIKQLQPIIREGSWYFIGLERQG